jgi:hypothetical protein
MSGARGSSRRTPARRSVGGTLGDLLVDKYPTLVICGVSNVASNRRNLDHVD